jgi:hypothetical protein
MIRKKKTYDLVHTCKKTHPALLARLKQGKYEAAYCKSMRSVAYGFSGPISKIGFPGKCLQPMSENGLAHHLHSSRIQVVFVR